MKDLQFIKWGEDTAPCYGCQDRTIGCHGQELNGLYKCSRYGDFVVRKEKEREKRKSVYTATDMIIEIRKGRIKRENGSR